MGQSNGKTDATVRRVAKMSDAGGEVEVEDDLNSNGRPKVDQRRDL